MITSAVSVQMVSIFDHYIGSRNGMGIVLMERMHQLRKIRQQLKSGECSIGSWIQLPDASVAEIMGHAGYDWVAVDLEHGSIGVNQLPDIFRALELGGTMPLVRLAEGTPKDCKRALDAGAAGVIIPMINSAEHLRATMAACCWPPAGSRGVGFSRANLFGKKFDAYRAEAQEPLIVAMIEHETAIRALDDILDVQGLDALFIGPYDLSASLGLTGQFEDPTFQSALATIRDKAISKSIAVGMHVVAPSREKLRACLAEGYQFVAYSIDAVMLQDAATFKSL